MLAYRLFFIPFGITRNNKPITKTETQQNINITEHNITQHKHNTQNITKHKRNKTIHGKQKDKGNRKAKHSKT